MTINPQKLKQQLLEDICVELSDEFDRNFERKGFFSDKWKPRAHNYGTGSLLMVSGNLRQATQGRVSGSGVRFTSSLPYAAIHNEGGKITVTAKMKKYFWAKYKETKNVAWKYMALMRVGHIIEIPERRFIGDGTETQKAIRSVIDQFCQDLGAQLSEFIKKQNP